MVAAAAMITIGNGTRRVARAAPTRTPARPRPAGEAVALGQGTGRGQGGEQDGGGHGHQVLQAAGDAQPVSRERARDAEGVGAGSQGGDG